MFNVPVNRNVSVTDNDSDQMAGSRNNSSRKSIPYGFQRRSRPADSEIILAIWVMTLLFEEIRQVILLSFPLMSS